MKSTELKASRALLAAAAVALAVGVTGCGEKPSDSISKLPPPPTDNPRTVQRADPPTESMAQKIEDVGDATKEKVAQAGKALDDATVTAKVKTALVTEPHLKSMAINVDTSGGVVTLRGTTDSQESKRKAEQLAATVEGVRSVRNELIVVRS